MEFANVAVTTLRTALVKQLPAYLQSLPFPKTMQGFAALKGAEWARLAPLLLILVVHVYMFLALFSVRGHPRAAG